jgi:hypothetical protein
VIGRLAHAAIRSADRWDGHVPRQLIEVPLMVAVEVAEHRVKVCSQ